MGLGSPTLKAGSVSAQVIAAIAAIELPTNHWSELIEVLLGFVNNQDNTNLKIATLQAIGFICETIVRMPLYCVINCLPCYLMLETRHLKLAVKRDFNSSDSRCTKGRTIH